ncbi:RNA polymerase subunit sigma-24 [Couchioplanes caeruleus subsp. caeruleus]|uniref:RNA polymerase subunit sigma-24 n=2 Tax=Couchioplanes caeruleus TaxID=56438 RepID=A0A1K0FP50_9ACTN|nr:RNA polymerase subunit sigma-24 [Couchioplanes caeruleus subsp. caeruleus]
MAALGKGDRDALAVLYRRHAPWLLLRLSQRCHDAGVVNEVVQDTFVAVWRGAARYRADGSVPAWIWGIGVRRLIDQFRAQKPATVPLVEEMSVEPSAEEQVLLGLEHSDLAAALQEINPELRAVVRATILDGLTAKEAARLLGIPVGTVKTRLMRARAALREELV